MATKKENTSHRAKRGTLAPELHAARRSNLKEKKNGRGVKKGKWGQTEIGLGIRGFT